MRLRTFARGVFAAALLTCAPALAQQDQPQQPVVQELILGENPYPQQAGKLQLIGSYYWAEGKGPDDTMEFRLAAEYGLTDVFQLGVDVPYRVVNPDAGRQHDGVGDVQVSALLNLFREPTDPFVGSLYVAASLPTGQDDHGLGEGEAVYTGAVLLAKRLRARLEVYANLGAQVAEGGDDDNLFYSVAGAYKFADHWAALLEFTGTVGDTDEGYVIPALYWLPSDDFQLAVGVPVGVGPDADNYRVTFQLVWQP